MDAASAASGLLTAVWQGRGFPVDPAWIAGQLGIRVIETTLPPEVSGALIKEPNQDPQIVLSKSDTINRKRFTCAHELGHFVSRSINEDKYKDEERYDYIDFRAQSAASGTDKEEIFANQFAAALLMPEEAIREVSKTQKETFLLLSIFGVSHEAMRIRLKSLGIS